MAAGPEGRRNERRALLSDRGGFFRCRSCIRWEKEKRTLNPIETKANVASEKIPPSRPSSEGITHAGPGANRKTQYIGN